MSYRTGSQRARGSSPTLRVFDSPLDMREIFRRLIDEEIRSGNLSKSRRRRIIQYASHLGITGVEVGHMIEQCRREALESDDSEVRLHALRLVNNDEPRIPTPIKIALVIVAAIFVDVIVLKLLVLP